MVDEMHYHNHWVLRWCPAENALLVGLLKSYRTATETVRDVAVGPTRSKRWAGKADYVPNKPRKLIHAITAGEVRMGPILVAADLAAARLACSIAAATSCI